ncbi:alpha/beta-hydrolase [Xylariaceae sp. FL0804]|nr:alpha/beta-hydrolase [Xylariaceae sp. FL0804]
MRTRSTVTTGQNGITWYYEQEGTGPHHVVLIPDGLGDCHMFDRALGLIAAAPGGPGFTVTTFDAPGMSRSASGAPPPESYAEVTASKAAGYVVSLLDALHIPVASFWGCSAGGATVLGLLAEYPERVRNGLLHEVPMHVPPAWEAWYSTADAELVPAVGAVMAGLCGDAGAWGALGEAAHARLRGNYPTFVRGHLPSMPLSVQKMLDGGDGGDVLAVRPLAWTVGAATPAAHCLPNVVVAARAGAGVVDVGVLPGMHFPYVSDPEPFAAHVVSVCREHVG